MCEKGREVLVFLIDRPGKWQVNAAGDDFLLTDAADAEEFVKLRRAFVEAVNAVDAHSPAATQPQ